MIHNINVNADGMFRIGSRFTKASSCIGSPLLIQRSMCHAQGLAAMEPILHAAQTMLESSTGLIQTARSLAVNPKDPPKWSVLAGHSRTVSDSIKKLITNMRYESRVCQP